MTVYRLRLRQLILLSQDQGKIIHALQRIGMIRTKNAFPCFDCAALKRFGSRKITLALDGPGKVGERVERSGGIRAQNALTDFQGTLADRLRLLITPGLQH